MTEIGHGYGSEYQLLRFLGHHRDLLNMIIKEQIPEINTIEWMDYPFDNKRISLDSEYKGINFLEEDIQLKLKNDWSEYWTGNTQNLDGIFYSKRKLYLVEAKAHPGEIESRFKSDDENNNIKINNAMYITQKTMGVQKNENWIGKYYQLANRLAFIYFLRSHGIQSHLVYIYFINGYRKRSINGRTIIEVENKNVGSKADWEKVIDEQYMDLGINNISIDKYLYKVFIDCEENHPTTAST